VRPHLLAMTEAAQTEARMGALPGLLEAVREELVARAGARGVRMEISDQLPRIAVERVVAQLALANVIGNSIKYCDPGKKDRWVRVSASVSHHEDTPFACLVVEDNGLGIPEQYRSRVFQRGFRAHPAVADGTGLGLTITRQLVLERGGTIDLTSEEGRGTRVHHAARHRCRSRQGVRRHPTRGSDAPEHPLAHRPQSG
jgi:signal transduction histidine kinase